MNTSGSAKLMRLLKLMKLMKMVRIYKASRVFVQLKTRLLMKSSETNLIKYLFILLIMTHWIACGWGLLPQLDTNANGGVDPITQGPDGRFVTVASANKVVTVTTGDWIVRLTVQVLLIDWIVRLTFMHCSCTTHARHRWGTN
jgi:hypothetical protein